MNSTFGRAAVIGMAGLTAVVGETVFDKNAMSQTAGACSTEIIQALKHTDWVLATNFSSGERSFGATTKIAADGAITIKTRKRGPFRVKCDGKNISFDWNDDPNKRYTLKLINDGNFVGERLGSYNPYDATLKKKN